MTEEQRSSDCTCEVCVRACKLAPGYFLPGEVAAAAALLGLSEQEFFDQYLSVGYRDDVTDADGEAVFALRPAVVGEEGEMLSDETYRHGGRCIFLTDGDRCRVHAAKPTECREMMHDDIGAAHGTAWRATRESVVRHRETIEAWRSHQDEVRARYQYPYVPEIDDSWSSWLS